jgi:hypothetical protein
VPAFTVHSRALAHAYPVAPDQQRVAITCAAPPETATAGELGIPGVDPNDLIEFDFSVQVVLKP